MPIGTPPNAQVAPLLGAVGSQLISVHIQAGYIVSALILPLTILAGAFLDGPIDCC